MIGEEMNSKAVIKKGGMTLIYDNITGRNCQIVDYQQNICKSDHTGLFIKNKFFKADIDTGVIRLPKEVGEMNNQ